MLTELKINVEKSVLDQTDLQIMPSSSSEITWRIWCVVEQITVDFYELIWAEVDTYLERM